MEADLELDCVATQQDTGTIYGIATASGNANNGIYDTYVVLVKSNPSPTDLISLKWSIVSTAPALDLSYVYPKFTTVDCAVSSKGEFIALSPNFELPTTKTPTIPMGVRYDPVSNSWSDIRGSPMYGWNSRTWHQLFYTTGNGVESLVHLVTDEMREVVRFGTVDTATNMLQLADIWKYDNGEKEYSSGSFSDVFKYYSRYKGLPRNGFFLHLGFTGQRLFTPGPNQLYIDPAYGDTSKSFPLTSAVTVSHTSTSSFSKYATFQTNWFFSGARGNLTTFVAAMGVVDKKSIYTIERDANGSWSQTTIHNMTGVNTEGDFDVHQNMITAGGRLPGQEPFAVAVATNGLYELQLFGPSAGRLSGPIGVTVSSSSLYSARPPPAIPKSPGLTVAEESGMIVGVFFAAVLFVWGWKKMRNQRKKEEKAKAATMGGGGNGEAYMMGAVPEIQTASEVAINVTTSDNYQRGGSPSASATPPATGSPQPSPAYTYQDDIQELEFSHHPPPYIATSVGSP
ncbi:hypothetical protein EC957_003123 [Mortierella hygrophila]|uniref:Uncharacterized protein n=1 Tax=Mortierella hygrophila TaxID=979708 RepID=A0A9P6F335_9FUNG|nr:hypothetical protein EC957_003123 [Mortierella hygrophila]